MTSARKWNLRGSFGVLDSGRTDMTYEDFRGHKLDREMLKPLASRLKLDLRQSAAGSARVYCRCMNAKLEHWSLRSRPLGEWKSPDDDGVCLFGFVMGHPRHCDGKEVLTSRVVRCQDNRIVTKSGSEYELGSPDPSYERSYPGALQRLFARAEQRSSKAVPPVDSSRTGVASLVKNLLKSFLVRQRTS